MKCLLDGGAGLSVKVLYFLLAFSKFEPHK